MEINSRLYDKVLSDLIEEANLVAGMWNGDNSGRLEDLAHISNDIVEHAEKIRELLEEYNNA